jgi:hypothetical protein
VCVFVCVLAGRELRIPYKDVKLLFDCIVWRAHRHCSARAPGTTTYSDNISSSFVPPSYAL